MELKDLRRMTSVKLREEALKHPDITGVHGLNKEQLVEALAKVYGIKMDEDKEAAKPKRRIWNIMELSFLAIGK